MAQKESATTQICPACGLTIDTTNAEPLARIACPKCGEKVRVERLFDQYVLLETLGIGGMATVYKARDILLDRDVALKLLSSDLEGGLDRRSNCNRKRGRSRWSIIPTWYGFFLPGPIMVSFIWRWNWSIAAAWRI